MTRRDLLLKALRPGVSIKRWLVLSIFGVIVVVLGTVVIDWTYLSSAITKTLADFINNIAMNQALPDWFVPTIGWVLIVIGLVVVVYGASQMVVSMIPLFISGRRTNNSNNNPKIVVIGGGSGTYPVLRAMRILEANVSAIVTVADSGGSTGILRDELSILATGDIRRCLLALSEQPLLDKIMRYRFAKNSSLSDHSMGNLMLASLTLQEGDFAEAVYKMSKVLCAKGSVIPFTIDNVSLCAKYEDDTIVSGEANIPKSRKNIKKVFFNPPYAKPFVRALETIADADVIIIGPGSLFTSIMPILLLAPIVDTIRRSSATKIYIGNIMTEPGETTGYKIDDHIQAIVNHTGVDFFDKILVSNSIIDKEILGNYRANGDSVPVDFSKVKDDERFIVADLAEISNGTLRHSETSLARALKPFIKKTKYDYRSRI